MRAISVIPYDRDQAHKWKSVIGMIDLSSGVQDEMFRILPDDALVLTTRAKNSGSISAESLATMRSEISGAAALIAPESKLDVMTFCSTSGTISLGEKELEREIHSVRPGIPVTNPFSASKAAFKELGIKNISFMAPYSLELAEFMLKSLEDAGICIKEARTFALDMDDDMCRIPKEVLFKAAKEQRVSGCDGLFICCTALRVTSLIEEIEKMIGIPVITSVQAMAWHSLKLSGYDRPVEGFGVLMRSMGDN